MTKHEAAIIQAYTGYVMLTDDDFDIFTKYCTQILGHPIFTHEYPEYADKIKELSKSDFIGLCKNLKD